MQLRRTLEQVGSIVLSPPFSVAGDSLSWVDKGVPPCLQDQVLFLTLHPSSCLKRPGRPSSTFVFFRL